MKDGCAPVAPLAEQLCGIRFCAWVIASAPARIVEALLDIYEDERGFSFRVHGHLSSRQESPAYRTFRTKRASPMVAQKFEVQLLVAAFQKKSLSTLPDYP